MTSPPPLALCNARIYTPLAVIERGTILIDLHVHGGGGHSLITEDPDEIRAYARWAVRHGVTAFLVTTLGESPGQLERLIAAAVPALRRVDRGARPLGLHLE